MGELCRVLLRVTGRFEKREQEVVDRSITNQFEVEQMLQTLESDRPQGRQTEQ